MKINDLIIKGRVRWARVHEPVPTYRGDALQWSMDLEADDKTYAKLIAAGAAETLKHRVSDDGEFKYVKLTRPTVSRSGKDMQPPDVFDRFGNRVTDAIGNDSVVAVKVQVFPEGSGAVRFSALQVIELVPYVPDRRTGFDIDEAAENDAVMSQSDIDADDVF